MCFLLVFSLSYPPIHPPPFKLPARSCVLATLQLPLFELLLAVLAHFYDNTVLTADANLQVLFWSDWVNDPLGNRVPLMNCRWSCRWGGWPHLERNTGEEVNRLIWWQSERSHAEILLHPYGKIQEISWAPSQLSLLTLIIMFLSLLFL